jgi:hypothetical protein
MRAELQKTNRELWRLGEERKRLNAAFAHDLRKSCHGAERNWRRRHACWALPCAWSVPLLKRAM